MQVFDDAGYGEECDWWSLGVLTHVLVAGASPWHLRLAQQQNEMRTYQRITAHAVDAIKLRGLRSTVLPAQDLINDLMHPTPQDRLGVRADLSLLLAKSEAPLLAALSVVLYGITILLAGATGPVAGGVRAMTLRRSLPPLAE